MQFNIPEDRFRTHAKQICALVFDLDDTLLDSQKRIPERALAAIRTLQERGFFISICTARNCSASQYYADLIGIRGVYSAGNGCQVVDGQTGDVLEARSMCDRDAVLLARFCLEYGASFSLSVGKDGYFGGRVDPNNIRARPDIYHKRLLAPGHSMERLTDANVLYGKPVYKIAVHDEGIFDLLSHYIRKNTPDVQCLTTSKDIINIFPAGCDKGTGVSQIAKQMDIPPERICVFGDFLNDVPMFEAAGLSIAMGNAAEAVRQKASAVTRAADEDGIAEALEAVFLAGQEGR